MTTQQQKKQTPTQTIKNWISEFVTKPNPVFGNLPPCPFAQKAIIENKVDFLELNSIASYNTLYQHIWDFNFEEKDVLCMIAQPDQFTAKETVQLAKELIAGPRAKTHGDKIQNHRSCFFTNALKKWQMALY